MGVLETPYRSIAAGGDKHGSALERLIEFGPCLLDEGLFEGFVGFVAAG